MGTNFAAPFELLRPVESDPLKYATQYANLAALAQMRQYRQQEMANQQQEMLLRQTEVQQKQDQIAQLHAINQAYTGAFKPDQNGVPQLDRGALTDALTKSGHGNAIPGILEAWEKYDQTHAELQTKHAELAKQQTDHAGTIGQLLKTSNYDPHLALTLIQDGAHKGTIDDTQGQQMVNEITSRLAQDPTGESARAWLQPITEQMIQNSPTQQALAKTAQELKTSQAAEKEATTRTAGLETANQLKAFELKTIQEAAQNPQKGSEAIDTIFPPHKYGELNTKFKAAYNSAGQGMADVNQIATAKQAVVKMALDAAKEYAPETIKAAADKAAAEAKARAPIDVTTGIATAVGKEKALAALAPAAFSGIVDTTARNDAIKDQSKAAGEHAKATAEAQQLEDFIAAARSGNQAAMANIPLATVRSLVNRVNRQELEAQGGQSYARRVQDYADKGITGKVSEDTLKDFAGLAQIARSKADAAYAGVADNINALGGNVPRTPPRAQAPAQSKGQNPNPNGYTKGHIYGGLTYLGGDPNNRASWKQ